VAGLVSRRASPRRPQRRRRNKRAEVTPLFVLLSEDLTGQPMVNLRIDAPGREVARPFRAGSSRPLTRPGANGRHGKEGVDGSSPSEGFRKGPLAVRSSLSHPLVNLWSTSGCTTRPRAISFSTESARDCRSAWLAEEHVELCAFRQPRGAERPRRDALAGSGRPTAVGVQRVLYQGTVCSSPK